MLLYIVIIVFLVLVVINVVYEIGRAKRIKRQSTKVDPEVYRKSDTHG